MYRKIYSNRAETENFADLAMSGSVKLPTAP